MTQQITKRHLSFVSEAKEAFENDLKLETYRNDNNSLIALRMGMDRDCIEVYEIESIVANFVNQMTPHPMPRVAVRDFSYHMETQLKVNEHKGHWKNEHPIFLLNELKRNSKALKEELGKNPAIRDKEEITIRCSNIANFAMMIADNEGV